MKLAERLARQFRRLPSNDRRALLVCTLFLVVVGGYIAIIEPVVQRYDRARAELAELVDDERRYQRQARMLPRREAKLSAYRSELGALNRRFNLRGEANESVVSQSISELTYYARLCDVTVGGIRPLDSVSAGEFIEVPLDVELSGSYEGLRKFFYYIDTSPSLLAVTDVDLGLEASAEGQLVRARLKVSNVSRPRAESADAPAREPIERRNQLRLVVSAWPGNLPLIVAKREGYLQSDTFRVELVRADDTVTIERLLAAGDADGISTTLPEVLNYWVKGIPLRVIYPLGRAAGTEGIVVRAESPIEEVADLRGLTVAVDGQGILLYVLVQALESADMQLADVAIVPLESSQVARDIGSGTLEAGLTREPFLSSLIAGGEARLVYASEDPEGLLIDMLAVNQEVLEEKAQALQFLVQALLQAKRFIAEQPEQATEMMADWSGQPLEATRQSIDKITLFSEPQAQQFFDEDSLKLLLGRLEAYFALTEQPFPLVTHEDVADGALVSQALDSQSGPPGRAATVAANESDGEGVLKSEGQ